MLPENDIESGSIYIHEQVVGEIIELTVLEIPDVKLVSSILDKMLELIGKKGHHGINVKMDTSGNAFLTVRISVKYGSNITEIAKDVQKRIKNAIEKVLDINIKRIDVQIHGIERGRK